MMNPIVTIVCLDILIKLSLLNEKYNLYAI